MDQRATDVPAAPDIEHDLGQRYQALRKAIDEAEKRLSRNTRGYLIGGTEPETTIARNRQALDMAALRPRVLRGVSSLDCSTALLGHSLAIRF